MLFNSFEFILFSIGFLAIYFSTSDRIKPFILQLAYHMGFKEVALIGCDHNFAQSGPAKKTVVSGEKDASHFVPYYFAGGVKWQLPDLLQSEVSYSMARDIYEGSGRKAYNCTDGGKLEIFDRMALIEFVARK
ncbi:MAG: hypothetical protein KGL90_11685 [Burkholderiales bacterium]|nr:hypothetical protein [Burkholderiales bacterium]